MGHDLLSVSPTQTYITVMNRKDDKDEWRSIPSGGGWEERGYRIGRLVVYIILTFVLLGGLGASIWGLLQN